MPDTGLKFPSDFLWGAAVSAHQTEGNNTNSDWWVWEHSDARVQELRAAGQNPADFQSGIACDAYHRYESDFDLAKKLNLNAFRVSLEWSRIEPTPGKYDTQALDHYRQVLGALRSRGMKTFVTLHHYTLPQWLAKLGGFENRETIKRFTDYAHLVGATLGELVDFWITINEPEIYASHAYFFGRYPPQKRSLVTMYKVARNLIAAHNRAADLLFAETRKPVSMSYHLSDLVPSSILARPSRNILHWITNEYVLNRTVRHCQYIGVNYYGHSHINFLGRRSVSQTKHSMSDLGWGIHPDGLERVLVNLKKYRLPLYITENGLADTTDTKRWQFIHDHLEYLHRALRKGVDVKGYLYWSLLDNFEWAHGFAPRFGLYAMDYATLARTVRPSALSYAEVCKTNVLMI